MENQEKLKEFEQMVRPLIEYLCNNHDPYATIIITPTRAELVQTAMGTGEILDYVRD